MLRMTPEEFAARMARLNKTTRTHLMDEAATESQKNAPMVEAPVKRRAIPTFAHAKPKKLRPLERDVLAATLALLRAHPQVAIVWRMQSGMVSTANSMYRIGTVGMPDIAGMLKGGRFFAIEVKRPGGQATPEQQGMLDEILRGGGVAGVADSVDRARKLIEGKL